MSDSPDWGKDEFPEVEPLSPQERKILNDYTADLRKAGERFDKWLSSVNKQAPRRRIKFSVELQGETLRKLMFLKLIVMEGYNAMPQDDFVRTLVQAGIEALYDSFVNSELAQVMKMMQVEKLPPPIRDAVVTTELKDFVKRLVAHVNKGSGDLREFLRVRTPVHPAPASRGDYQKIMRKTAATPTGATPEEGEPCAHCAKPLAANDTMEYEGKKFHQDCLIDYGLRQMEMEKKDENGKSSEGSGAAV